MIFGAELVSFKRESWTRGTYGRELALSEVASIESELDDLDVHAIARRQRRPITIRFGDGQSTSVNMSCENALALYDAGHQIYIRDVSSPALREWCRHLSDALEVPNRFSCGVWAAQAPFSASMQFSQFEIFTVQLAGTNIWSVAENTAVQKPTASYDCGADYHSEELGLFVKKFPIPSPEVTRAYNLTPGHMLYVPQGFWHTVSGASESPVVSLLISYPSVTWADLIASALRSLLLRDARWRENAKTPSLDDSDARKERFYSLFTEAAEQVSTFDMSFLVPWKKSEAALPTLLIRNPLATLTYEDSGHAQRVKAISRVHLGTYTRTLEADIPVDLKPMLEFVCNRNETPVSELKQMIPEMTSFEQAFDTLRELDLVRPGHRAEKCQQ